jgi:hypothetical protein
MKKCGRVVVFLIAVLMVNSLAVSAYDGVVRVPVPIGTYEIEQTQEGQYVSVEDFGRLLVAGKPDLPSKIFAIAIPPGAEVAEVTFDVGQGIVLPGTYNVAPATLARVIGEEDPLVYAREKQAYDQNYSSVYGSDEPYPASVGEFVRTAGFRKYNLVDVRVSPVTYRPQSGELTYHSNVTVHVSYTYAKGFSPDDIMIDNLPRKERLAKEIILNYDEAQSWYPAAIGGKESFDFVFITLESLVSEVAPLVTWEISKGRTVQVVTTSWISANYAGWDLTEKVRNFLLDKYPSEEWGIEDVLLIADYNSLPPRRVWVDLGYGKPETDFYFAELSKPDSLSWDRDGDHQYAENYVDPVDFYAEIVVGRIPWSNPSTVQQICGKSAAYEQNQDPAFKKNILLLGAYFWENTDNAVLMETKINQPWMFSWTKTRMYEQGHSTYPSDYNLTYSNVLSVWSSGQFAFVNWAGHGSPHSVHIMYSKGSAFATTSTCPSLNDDYPSIVFADACSNSDTDYDNIGRAMLGQGAVGFLGATKVAYGRPGWNNPYSGSSQSFDYFFTICVTSGDYTQGQGHQWALIEMYQNNLWGNDKYEHFEWSSYWGNPNLGMGPVTSSYPPATPTTPAGTVEAAPGVEHDFSSSTTDPEGENIFYLFDWGDGTDSDWLGPYSSGETCTASKSWADAGAYDVSVKAKDIYDRESGWSNALSVARYVCGDANDDGVIDIGDAIYVINYLYKNDPAPDPWQAGDPNNDDVVQLGDVIFLINYLFKNGPSPGC